MSEQQSPFAQEGYDFMAATFEVHNVLGAEHEAQLINYMRISRSSVGYLVNFGPIKKLEYKRFILSEFL
ncbi:GxxExxY protein [Novipirellula aureliae]|nr:GxxExxY protein [Novipirellula aureliae]